jgi:hypothetical protein
MDLFGPAPVGIWVLAQQQKAQRLAAPVARAEVAQSVPSADPLADFDLPVTRGISGVVLANPDVLLMEVSGRSGWYACSDAVRAPDCDSVWHGFLYSACVGAEARWHLVDVRQ